MAAKTILQTLDKMSAEDFDAMLKKGLSEAKTSKGMSVEYAFAEISKRIKPISKRINKHHEQ